MNILITATLVFWAIVCYCVADYSALGGAFIFIVSLPIWYILVMPLIHLFAILKVFVFDK